MEREGHDGRPPEMPFAFGLLEMAVGRFSMHGAIEAKGRLSLFGGFRLTVGEREVRLPSPKQRALLAYLALSMPEPQPRSHLMALLWGSRFEEQARLSLRQALMGLRRELGPGIIVADRETVCLVENSLECDATRLPALAEEGSRESLLAASQISGEFLKGLSIEEEAFAEWLLRSRQRLTNLQIECLQALAERELQGGCIGEAIAHLQGAVRLDEYREDSHCLLMSALVTAGRRADALRHAEALSDMLKGQLGVGLSRETQELVNRVRQASDVSAGEAQHGRPGLHDDRPAGRSLAGAGSAQRLAAEAAPGLNGGQDGAALDQGRPTRLPPHDRPSIAVLPFTNLSGDPEQDYVADGMVEDIITALSRLRWLSVIARNTSFGYKGRAADVREVGRELGVRYVLGGSVRRDGNRVRISGQLIEAETGFHVWSDRYDSELSSIFDLQDRVAESVLAAIETSLRQSEMERARRKPESELGAYDLYMRALAEMGAYSQSGHARARTLLEAAVSRDPNFADAWASLADCIGRSALFGWIADIDTAQRQAYDAAMKAVAADPSSGTVLALAAWACATMAGRVEQAAEYASRAIELAPTSAVALTQCGWVFVYNGESERALQCVAMARRLDPLDPRRFTAMAAIAAAHFFARRFDKCIQISRRVIEEAPSLSSAWRFLAAALVQKGEIDEAGEVIRELLVHQPSSSLSRTAKATRFRHGWMVEMYLGSLRQAGLPE